MILKQVFEDIKTSSIDVKTVSERSLISIKIGYQSELDVVFLCNTSLTISSHICFKQRNVQDRKAPRYRSARCHQRSLDHTFAPGKTNVPRNIRIDTQKIAYDAGHHVLSVFFVQRATAGPSLICPSQSQGPGHCANVRPGVTSIR